MKKLYLAILALYPLFCLAQTSMDHSFLPDCVLPESVYTASRGYGTFSLERHWPGQIIPYQVQFDTPDQTRDIDSAIQMLNTLTNVCIIPRGSQEAYIDIASNPDPAGPSFVYDIGYAGEIEHQMRLSPRATRATIIHEFNHSLGLFHEHQRPDRDNYIEINWSNVNPDYAYVFNPVLEDDTYRTFFDFKSNMLYRADAFSRNGLPTIVYTDSTVPIPNERLELGDYDIATINKLYPLAINCDSIYTENVIDIDMQVYTQTEGIDFCAGMPVQLEGIPVGHDGEGWTWQWIIIEGEVEDANNRNTEVTFSSPGEKRILLKARNHYMEKTVVRNISIVDPRPALDIYPNPITNGQLTIELSITAPSMQMTVFDAMGRSIQQFTIESQACREVFPLEISRWQKGLYYLRLDDGKQSLIRTLSKQ